MVEFTLPEELPVKQGKTFRRPPARRTCASSASTAGTPTTGENPRIDTYESTSTIAGRWCSTR
jgi:hypothetical protein